MKKKIKYPISIPYLHHGNILLWGGGLDPIGHLYDCLHQSRHVLIHPVVGPVQVGRRGWADLLGLQLDQSGRGRDQIGRGLVVADAASTTCEASGKTAVTQSHHWAAAFTSNQVKDVYAHVCACKHMQMHVRANTQIDAHSPTAHTCPHCHTQLHSMTHTHST